MMNSRQRILRLMPLCLAATLSLVFLTGSALVLADPPQSGNSDTSKSRDDKDKEKSKASDDKSDNSNSRNKSRNKDSDDTPRSKRNNSSSKDDDAKSGSSSKKSSDDKSSSSNKSRSNSSNSDSSDKDKSDKSSSSSSKKTQGKNSDDKTASSSKSKSKSKSDDEDDVDKGKSKKTVAKDDSAKKDESSKKDDDKKKASSKDKDKDSKADVAKHSDDKDSDKKNAPVKVDSGKKDVDDKKQAAGDSKPEAGAKDVTASRGDHKMEPTEGEFENHESSATGKTAPHGKPEAVATTSSTDMQGWELVRLDGRDYVTSASLQKFYHFTQHQFSGNAVELRSAVLVLQGVVGSQDLMINGIKFILSYPVAEYNGKPLFSRLDLCKLIDPVLRPSFISNSAPFDTVIIDAGHGGHDSGARGIFGYEKDYALQLGFLLKSDLEHRGLKVVMTRSDDTFISLGGRVEMANKVPNSIFVALHFNSGPGAATGIETYALSPQGSSSVYGARDVDSVSFSGNTRDSENIALATAVHAMVVHHFRLVDRGVKRARWYVLTGLQRPGILFEGGFVTNEGDGRLIAAENFRLELAKTIGDAIMNYRRALQPHSAAYQGR